MAHHLRSTAKPAQGVSLTSRSLYDPTFEHDACGFGFVVDIRGRRSHDIVADALTVLVNLEHRGASGAEKNTGDGAGLTSQLPHAFFVDAAAEAGFALPPDGAYGVGMLFLPRDVGAREACEEIVTRVAAREGLTVIGWRNVPTDHSLLGDTARSSEPTIRQVFLARPYGLDEMAFERALYIGRRQIEEEIRRSKIGRAHV